MTIFYSRVAKGFFDSSIHVVIPPDAVEITADEHASLMVAQATGKIIGADGEGRPVAVDPPPPSADEAKASVLAQLAEVDAQTIRSLREWVVAQPNAPQFLKDREAAAQAARAKLKQT